MQLHFTTREKNKIAIKYRGYDLSGGFEKYQAFYDLYPYGQAVSDINDLESKLLYNLYKTWYCHYVEDGVFEISSSRLMINMGDSNIDDGYQIVAAVEQSDPYLSLLFSFDSEPDEYYCLEIYSDPYCGLRMDWFATSAPDSRVTFSEVTYSDWLVVKEAYEAEQARLEQLRTPQYSNSTIINKTVSRVKEYASSGYSGTERLYHGTTTKSSSVEFDWESQTYTCYVTN